MYIGYSPYGTVNEKASHQLIYPGKFRRLAPLLMPYVSSLLILSSLDLTPSPWPTSAHLPLASLECLIPHALQQLLYFSNINFNTYSQSHFYLILGHAHRRVMMLKMIFQYQPLFRGENAFCSGFTNIPTICIYNLLMTYLVSDKVKTTEVCSSTVSLFFIFQIAGLVRRRGKAYFRKKFWQELLRSTFFLTTNGTLFIACFCIWR